MPLRNMTSFYDLCFDLTSSSTPLPDPPPVASNVAFSGVPCWASLTNTYTGNLEMFL